MPLSTYSELQNSIKDYLEQDDISAKVTDFIRLCEVRLNRNLSVQEMHKTYDVDIDTNEVDLPVDFIKVVSWRLSNPSPGFVATPVPPNRFFAMGPTSLDGTPRAYTIMGRTAYWAPDPTGVAAGTYPSQLEYLSEIPALSPTNTTNWLLSRAPDLYLYGSLLEAQPFLIDDERLKVWAEIYKESLTSMQGLDSRGKYPPGSYMRPARIPFDGKRWARF